MIIGFVQYQHSSVEQVRKNGQECQVKSHQRQRKSTSRVAHSAITNMGRSIIIQGKKNGVHILNLVLKATYLKKKLKVGISEMHSNSEDSYRPVIIGFVHYQHSSVQLKSVHFILAQSGTSIVFTPLSF